uniref:Putative secreted protein n=1 Tax=Anopheles darlingi TaxID=43151 RepID=A0A2M4DPR0_ANODA
MRPLGVISAGSPLAHSLLYCFISSNSVSLALAVFSQDPRRDTHIHGHGHSTNTKGALKDMNDLRLVNDALSLSLFRSLLL